ncbi:bifunctional glycosyltransferase family 2 protein/CDP-glycerol:glycerophosphate glycerophosphotransferase [Streptomyces sp. NPDC050095]|uniref:bifunctional glycosyltransferase/CDP-glycerol:glycerophosphate glycerophosphotransferase n=1 Tax=unclassified Streptomyces TaxID=2593676 RepID=UPI00342DEB45
MTKLSVIVYGRDVQGLLGTCLESVATQLPAEAELVVAAVGTAAQSVAAEHDGTVVALPEGTSDADARAAGAERASGEWLWFVHAKDHVHLGALRMVLDRLIEQPATVDVLLVDHMRDIWPSTNRGSFDTGRLARVGRREMALADAPNLLQVTPILGNRIVHADLWRAHQGELTADEMFAARALLIHADRIACLEHPVIDIRELRPESLPPVTPEQRYQLIESFEALQRLMRSLDVPVGPRTVLYNQMATESTRVVARQKMPDAVAKEFFHRASAAAVRWKPEGHKPPGGLEGIRRRLLEEDAYTKYRAFQTANVKRRELKTTLRERKKQLGQKVQEHHYHKALREPIDPNLAVFSAYWDRGVACNPAAIAAKLRELAPQVRQVWVVSKAAQPLLPPGTDHVVPGTRQYWEVMARAKYFINNVNFPNAVVKRPGSVHVMTHHGTPLKKMGMDQLDYPTASKGLDFDALLERVDRWDYSVSANSHTTRMWERAYPSHFVSLDIGYPRNDVYYHASAADVRSIRERLGIAPGKRAVLYAPTHRDYEASWTPRLDLAALSERLGEDTVLLVRGHYFYGSAASPLASLRRTGRVIDVSGYDPVEELCLAADVLITDYSSIMFDYANLDRPIISYADDWETYAKTRGVYFDLMEEPPGHVARTQEELEELLVTDAWHDEASTKARTHFRRRFCDFDDGNASERFVRRVFLGESEESLPAIVPLESRTPAPTPEEANA